MKHSFTYSWLLVGWSRVQCQFYSFSWSFCVCVAVCLCRMFHVLYIKYMDLFFLLSWHLPVRASSLKRTQQHDPIDSPHHSCVRPSTKSKLKAKHTTKYTTPYVCRCPCNNTYGVHSWLFQKFSMKHFAILWSARILRNLLKPRHEIVCYKCWNIIRSIWIV